MPRPSPLASGSCHHTDNRATKGENIFAEDRNDPFSLERYAIYIESVAFTHTCCLMKNDFHLLMRTKTPEEQRQT